MQQRFAMSIVRCSKSREQHCERSHPGLKPHAEAIALPESSARHKLSFEHSCWVSHAIKGPLNMTRCLLASQVSPFSALLNQADCPVGGLLVEASPLFRAAAFCGGLRSAANTLPPATRKSMSAESQLHSTSKSVVLLSHNWTQTLNPVRWCIAL